MTTTPQPGTDPLDAAFAAAGLGMVQVDPDDGEPEYYEWHECADQPNCNVVSRGEPCPCSGMPWPSPVVQAAIRAAAPHIERAAPRRVGREASDLAESIKPTEPYDIGYRAGMREICRLLRDRAEAVGTEGRG